MDSIAIPVIAGIAAWILLFAAVSYTFSPYKTRSDAEVWEYVNSLHEVQAFRDKFQNVEGKIWRDSPYYHKPFEFQVTLASSKEFQTTDGQQYNRTLGLTLVMGYSGLDWTFLGCGPMPTYLTHVTVEDIRTSECLDP